MVLCLGWIDVLVLLFLQSLDGRHHIGDRNLRNVIPKFRLFQHDAF